MEDLEKKIRVKVSESAEIQRIIASLVANDAVRNYSNITKYEALKKENNSEIKKNSAEDVTVDIVIIVAIPDEKDGVINAFGIRKSDSRSLDLLDKYGFGYNRFEQDGMKIALLLQPGMGMTQSSSLATRAILAFKPKLIAMVGICAGRVGKTNLGDIIIASSVYDYTAGKHYVDRFGPRPQSYPFDSTMSEFVAASVIDNHELIGKIFDGYQGTRPDHQIKVHFKPIASGTAVIDDPEIVKEVAKSQDDLAGIDMEAYALAVAANILRTKWIVIKSVQDFANGEKSSTEGGIRTFSAYASAKLLQLTINELSKYI